MTLSERQTALKAELDATRQLYERAMQVARDAELQLVRTDAQIALLDTLIKAERGE